jgi:HupE / UreJ protein
MLLVRGRLALLKTITAFTLAHSATLALSALGLVRLPLAPVEAAIALSILFLACELAKPQASEGLAARRPWAVAFAFGLLHGFGFAGALAEVGLPQGDVPLALLLFNLGVEAGQLIFVAGALLLLALARSARELPLPLPFPLPVAGPLLRGVPVLAVGSLAAFWCLQRMAVVVGVSVA